MFQYSYPNVQEGIQWFYSRGGPTFSRGEGGVQILISIEPYITCDLPGGSKHRGSNTDSNRSLSMRTN